MGIETSVPSTPAGFILIGVEASAEDGIGDALAYQVVSATGSYSPVWSGSVDVAGNTVAFRLKGVVS